jgi:hypothetical protein
MVARLGLPPCHSDVGVAAAAPGSVGVGRTHGADALAFFTWSASRTVPRPCPFLNGQRLGRQSLEFATLVGLGRSELPAMRRGRGRGRAGEGILA